MNVKSSKYFNDSKRLLLALKDTYYHGTLLNLIVLMGILQNEYDVHIQ